MAELTQEQKAALFDEVQQDRPLFRMLQKKLAEKHPDAVIPEVELSNDIDAVRAEADKKYSELQAQLQEERDARKAAEELSRIKMEHGVDDAQLTEVTKFMEENKIGDLDSGLKFKRLADQAERNKVSPMDRSTMQLPEGFKEAVKDRRGHRRRKLYEGLADVQKQMARQQFLATQ